VSVAVQVTELTPKAKVDPFVGLQITEASAQLSVAVGAGQVTTALQTPLSFVALMLAGQAMAGFSVSLTMTAKLQLLVFPLASVAVQLTVLLPFAKVLPLVGVQLTSTPGQLSLAEAVKVTLLRLHWPGSVLSARLAGQLIAGG